MKYSAHYRRMGELKSMMIQMLALQKQQEQ